MVLSTYQTVKGKGEHEIIIQKSRFIAFFDRVETEEAAQAFIEKIKKDHWNANHNCSAYLIGERDEIQKANDDGEPSGTAGVPMLEVLKKRGLKDTVVVVTRYFGGIKLGAGGLIRAYGGAVSEGLNAIGVVQRSLVQVVHTAVDYHWLGKVEHALRESPYQLKGIDYLEQVDVQTFVEVDKLDAFEEWMINITNGQANITRGEQTYLETDI
ncbi:protein co-occurring with transport systems [Halalkalibacter wakoensis JCM 9140]|uniref:Protein co-occurring with transport systems n=1 Tax=Halalkalibacter wakoensis JCM 9140 TaxID=1236970 RepID=W4Q360_9BACI|nr:YigZ family protein [Halalkalibacter wakoensis]GAE26501.1 protein co-occurring with transport systems [Halalkalibacter wakoensis JCM 9140]